MAAAAQSLFSVAGKNVVITGGSRGIGYMIAKGFVNAGANVLLTSRDEKACAQAVESIRSETSSSASCQYVTSNVSTREGCDAFVDYISKDFLTTPASDEPTKKRLDVLINNAGTSWGEPLERNSSKRSNWGFDKVFDLNVKGLFYLSRACIPLMETTKTTATDEEAEEKEESTNVVTDPARIINIGSVAGFIPQSVPTHAYDLSKCAVHHLTKKLAADLAPKQITVNCLAPGFVPSRMSDGMKAWGGTRENITQNIPLQRMGTEEDMVGSCLYFSSRAGAWCTGVILNVDGGTVGALQIPVIPSNL